MSHTVDKPDMGYNTGFYDGKKAEQERIIKLLDESLIYDEPVVIQRDQLIELIKEKNK